MRCIITKPKTGAENMAIDEALLQLCKEPVIRFYQWIPKAISIGYAQDIEKEINLDFCKQNNIKMVRRLTGGKAVLHDQEVTYSFVAPIDKIDLPKQVNESYRVIADALVYALKTLNIDAVMKKQPERLATSICFNSSNWYELEVNNKKISGSAQRRINNKILQHGPILLDFDAELNAKCFKTMNELDTKEQLKKRITSLKKEATTPQQLINALKKGFEHTFNTKLQLTELTDEERVLANKLTVEKYTTDKWNKKEQPYENTVF
ncbi:MAG: biotin/lipoate A/B protein ligase family protein [Nanoarchaeota archaeon]|nr:biotin/lipoate A/B protein ligase family protein [Nanoarchaeota archaeon]